MKERILQIMEQEGLTSSKFAEAIGIQRSAMSHILLGRNKPSLDVVLKILERFTYVDTDWLLFGKGEMRKGNASANPDLFTNTPENRPEVQPIAKNREEMIDKTTLNNNESTIKEHVIYQETTSKRVSRIMVFYSDSTFDVFVPEKNKKE